LLASFERVGPELATRTGKNAPCIHKRRNIDLVGTIPADLQFVQVFAAGVVKGAKNPEACKRLIEYLASEKATPTVEKTGMKRPVLR
jgi:ABC-type Fe3+ transport system substrate-binding protein